MVARAKALIPELRDRASKTEALRRLPPETERDLHDAGLFRIVQPKRVGGAELDYVALVDCAVASWARAVGTLSYTFHFFCRGWLLPLPVSPRTIRVVAGEARAFGIDHPIGPGIEQQEGSVTRGSKKGRPDSRKGERVGEPPARDPPSVALECQS